MISSISMPQLLVDDENIVDENVEKKFRFIVDSQQQQYYGSPQLQSSIAVATAMPTVTVRGFLNFRTTVDGTVIVFTPSPNSNTRESSSITTTQPPLIESTRVPVAEVIKPTKPTVIPTYPTGLVTVLGGTVINEGSTTVYETKVIGTYISGKYAQILSSTTKIKPNEDVSSPTVRPTNTYSHHSIVRSTRMPYQNHHHHQHHNYHNHHGQQQQQQQRHSDPLPRVDDDHRNEEEHTTNAITGMAKKMHPLRAKSIKLVESSKARHLNARLQLNPLKSRWAKLKDNADDNGKNNNGDGKDNLENHSNNPNIKIRRLKILGSKRFTLPPRQSPRVKMNRFKSKLPATQAEEMQHYYNSKEQELKDETAEAITTNNNDTNIESMKPSINAETKEKFWKIFVKEVQTITSEVTQHVEGNHLQVKTLTLTTTIERTLHPTESEFDTHLIQPTLDIVGNNIEATSVPETPALVISRTYSVTERTMRTTVVPVFDGTTTQSHTVTESFFIRKLITAYRTLPPGDMILIDSTSTSAFNPEMNTAFINGTDVDDLSMAEQQTIQPTSVDSNILPTEMPMILDENILNDDNQQQQLSGSSNQIEPSLVFGNAGQMPQMMAFPQQPNQLAQQFDLNNPLLLAAVLQNPQLAALYIGLQQQQQQQQMKQPTQYSTITKPTKVMQTETLYNTKLVSYYDGRQTRSRTILEPTGTTEKLVNTYTTEVIPIIANNNQYGMMQQAQLQNMFATQFGMMPQFQVTPTLQSSTILKTMTTVTETTMTKSKVYTLVYNAFSTRYRTITSTSVMPTTVTTVLTETIPLTQSSSIIPQMNFFG
ncbi:hypothetical protein HUG17_4940 [Dermatophagoides farinae]|uniref:DUF4758 domain-containing protein n=1 Tax=Dermatophagoides farinae TaxID=6954 RepID=A0A9D4NZB3_DERFA|nr:hypothetical protein HUG17_4940 [Dermatophagoides farinae]